MNNNLHRLFCVCAWDRTQPLWVSPWGTALNVGENIENFANTCQAVSVDYFPLWILWLWRGEKGEAEKLIKETEKELMDVLKNRTDRKGDKRIKFEPLPHDCSAAAKCYYFVVLAMEAKAKPANALKIEETKRTWTAHNPLGLSIDS